MTWTYTLANPLTTRDQIRLLVADTTSTDPLLQDEEIDTLSLLEMGNPSSNINVFRVASQAASQIATGFMRQADQSNGDVHIRFRDRAEQYFQRAERLAVRARRSGAIPYAGGISEGDKQTVEENSDRVAPMFTRDMLTAPGTSTGALPVGTTNWPVPGLL